MRRSAEYLYLAEYRELKIDCSTAESVQSHFFRCACRLSLLVESICTLVQGGCAILRVIRYVQGKCRA